MYALKKILVPTDFSSHAAAALDFAVLFGSLHEAEITLLHADEYIVSPLGASGVRDEVLDLYQQKKMDYLRQELDRVKSSVAGRSVSVRTMVIPGRAYKVIIEEAEKSEYDLVVIATRGLTVLSTHLIGATAERVVRLSRQPVLSVQEPPKPGGKIHAVLCPTDCSPAANIAFTYALSIALQNSARLFVQYISELDKPETEADVRKRLPDLAGFHPRAKDVEVEYIFDRDIDPSNSIIRFADDRDVDLIVMSTHGRKGLRRVYVGNNTAEVVRQSTRPVLTVTHPLHKAVFSRPVTQAEKKHVQGVNPGRKQ